MNAEQREERLDAVIAEYLLACEAGRAPDRRELLSRHPELRAELLAFFADHDGFHRMAVPLRALAPDAATPPAAGRTVAAPVQLPCPFGGYELLEEVGRGGMGVVYRARQAAPQRVVALKMILGGRFASPADLERFRREADLVAGLDHPNIVPIYEVGEHQGQHYFTMKLVEGGNLAQHLDRFRAEPRAAARLVATVARAVHHAHQRGLLHRDLKPANVLLAACALAPVSPHTGAKPQAVEWVPHITDFGLAKRLPRPGDGAAPPAGGSYVSLTTPGTAVGTPSYMAPEQAAGEVTTAADVYALGAILYELLTGRPPFKGATPVETLMQVLGQEAPAPRALDPRIDRDLEAVCLKCLRRGPGRRYASARDLAEDLERFLAGEPVLARPVGRAERLQRWCRRSPVTACLLAALVAALAGGFALVAWQWRRADAQARLATAAAATAQAQRDETERQKQDAEESFRLAHQAVRDFCTRVSEGRLASVPGLQPVRKELLQDALGYYRTFIKRHADDPRLEAELADAHFRVGAMTAAVGTYPDALAAYQEALPLYEKSSRANPGDARARLLVARTYNNMATLYGATGNQGEALRCAGRARDRLEPSLRPDAGDVTGQTELGRAYRNLAVFERQGGRTDDALRAFEKSRDLLGQLRRAGSREAEVRRELASTCHNLAYLQHETGRLDDALASYQEAYKVHEELAGPAPEQPDLKSWLAGWHRNVGALQHEMKQPLTALDSFKRAAALYEELARANPAVTEYTYQVANVYNNVGALLMEMGSLDQVRPWYNRAEKLQQDLVLHDPQVALYRRDLARTYRNRGILTRLQGRSAEALISFQQAREVLGQMRHGHPETADDHYELGQTLWCTGQALEQTGRPEDALTAYRQAVAALRQAQAGAPQLIEYRRGLSQGCGDLARLARALGHADEAAAAARERLQLWPGQPDVLYQFAAGLAVQITTVEKLAKEKGLSQEDVAQQRLYGDEALESLRAAVALGFRDADQLRRDSKLDPLRSRDDFKKLLADLEAARNGGKAP
jgi:tetratricopeptide (TPR) repeat protein